MGKSKFRFDSETLQYRDVRNNKRRKFTMVITQLMAAVVIAFVLFVVMSYVSETPKQRKYKRENKLLVQQYKILSERKTQTDKLLQELQERDKRIHRAILESDPVEDTTMIINSYELLKDNKIEAISGINSNRISSLNKQLEKQSKEYAILLKILNKNIKNIEQIPAIQPVKNINFKYTMYGYGTRIDPIYKTPVFHSGVDFAAPEGTKVYATADGTVTRADSKQRGLGNHIRIKHGNGYETIYAHLNKTKVRRNQKVKRGDFIGTIGNTGKSFIPHLHYEVLHLGKSINPVNYFLLDLSPEDYEIMQAHTSRIGLSLD